MAQSTRTKQSKSTPTGSHRQGARNAQFKVSETSIMDGAAPEAAVSSLDTLERSLQGVAGDGVLFSMDPETRAQNLLALQQMVGNQSVQRAIQRQPIPAPAPGVTPPSGLPATPASSLPQDLRDFRARGPMPAAAAGSPITVGGGGFNARYDPTAMVLTLTLNLGMNFIDGMRISGNRVTSTQASMDGSAVAINRMLSRLS